MLVAFLICWNTVFYGLFVNIMETFTSISLLDEHQPFHHMKTFPLKNILAALAVAMAVSLSHDSLAQSEPIPSGSPLADVVKLVQSGVDASVIKTYIANTAGTFDLDAGKIISLTDLGVPADVINAMMAHDKNLVVAAQTPPPAPANNNYSSGPDTAPPPAPVTVNYFYDNLSPYGSWVEVEGYGRCWRPTAVIYDPNWRPYCDRGHWVYTDCGWYWDSDYSWGVTFHYGRWFRHDRFGWCWYPDTVWAPSWVTWRSSDAYCGWAPLPPFAEYRPGFGFFYRGANVSVGFDFGLGADYFTFVSVGRMCERHPREFRENHERVTQIFNQTTIINNYYANRQTVVNNGIPVDRVNTASHRPIQTVAVAELPNAARHGWRGDGDRPGQHLGNNNSPDSRPNQPGHNQSTLSGERPAMTLPESGASVRPANENIPARQSTSQSGMRPDRQHERDAGSQNNNFNVPSIANPQPNNRPANEPIIRNHQQPNDAPVGQNDGRNYQRQNNNSTTTFTPVPPTRPSSHETGIDSPNRWPNSGASDAPRTYSPPPSAPQPPAQHQYIAPATPAAPANSDRWQQREQKNETPQPRQYPIESAPHNYTPQQAQSQPSVNQQPRNKDWDKNQQNH